MCVCILYVCSASDYGEISQEIAFSATTIEALIEITLSTDNLVEPSQEFSVVLESDDLAVSLSLSEVPVTVQDATGQSNLSIAIG